MLPEPFANGLVVEFERSLCNGDNEDEEGNADGDVRADRSIGMARCPCRLNVNPRIVRDIERIGNVTQPFAYGSGSLAADWAACSQGNDQREKEQHGNHVIRSVYPRLAGRADAGDTEQGGDDKGTPPETAFGAQQQHVASGEQQAHKEGIDEAGESDVEMLGSGAESAEHGVNGIAIIVQQAKDIQVQRDVDDGESRNDDGERKHQFGEVAEYECIKDVGDVFPIQRPCRAVQRIHLLPATDVPAGCRGAQREGDARYHQRFQCEEHAHLPPGGVRHGRELGPVAEIEEQRAYECAENEHGVQACDASLAEFPGAHALPAVIVGVTDDEAREHEEEVDGQIAVVEHRKARASRIGFAQMIAHDDECCHTAQSVQDFVTRLGGERGCSVHDLYL